MYHSAEDMEHFSRHFFVNFYLNLKHDEIINRRVLWMQQNTRRFLPRIQDSDTGTRKDMRGQVRHGHQTSRCSTRTCLFVFTSDRGAVHPARNCTVPYIFDRMTDMCLQSPPGNRYISSMPSSLPRFRLYCLSAGLFQCS